MVQCETVNKEIIMSRIRSVYPSDMVCHLWANHHTHSIRNSTNTIFAESGVLYSYGRHYAIGAFINNDKGELLLLMNTHSRSITTAQHVAKAWHALDSRQRQSAIRVPTLSGDSLRDISSIAHACMQSAGAPLQSCKKARDRLPVYIEQAREALDNARKLYAFIGNEKQSARVPTLPENAGKIEADKVYRELMRDSVISACEKLQKNAIDTLSRFSGDVEFYSARGILQNLTRGLSDIDSAIGKLKGIGEKIPRALSTLRKQYIPAMDAIKPRAMAEEIAISRDNLSRLLTGTMQEIAHYRRDHVRGRASRFWHASRLTSEIAPQLMDSEQARKEWGDSGPGMLPFVQSVQARANRITRFCALDSALKTLNREMEEFDSGAKNPPLTRYVLQHAKSIGTIPAFWQARIDSAIARANAQNAQHARNIALLHAQKIEAWRKGENVYLGRDIGPLMRIKGDKIETSFGAFVPLEHGARLLRIARAIQARGGMQFDDGKGPIVGHFRVTYIGADFRIIIGCHDFAPEECEHAARIISESFDMQSIKGE